METVKKTHSFFLKRKKDLLCEALFHSFWECLKEGTELNTPYHERVRILSPGIWNGGKEPDFRSARILFQGKIFEGDVILHEKASDYIRNGHLSRGCCSDVIAHVFTLDDIQRPAEKKDGPTSHILECIVPRELLFSTDQKQDEHCRIFRCMSDEGIREFFLDAGHERLQQKSIAVLEDMIRSGTEKAFCKVLLSSAGSSHNSEAFAELYRRVSEYPGECFKTHYRALLWGESSLLPDPVKTPMPEENCILVRSLWDEFWSIRNSSREKIIWKHHSIRPFNSPERRIAMICAFFDKFSISPMEYFAEILHKNGGRAFIRRMKKELTLSDHFWDRHCNFRTGPMDHPASILGKNQAETLLTDAMIPSLLALGKLKDDPVLEREASLLTEYLPPRKDPAEIRRAFREWFPGRPDMEKIFDNACMTQAVLYVLHNFCTKETNCADCILSGP